MPKQREKMTEVHSCGSPPFSTCLGAVASFIISQGQKCHKKPFPLVYYQSHKEKSVKGGHRPQRLPLILFFVGYNAGGENGCPSVSLLPPVLHCPFRRKKVREQLQELNRQSRTELENSLLKEALAMSSENCEELMKQSNQEQVRAEQNRQRDAEQNRKLISELKQSVELLKNSNELLQDAISGEIGSLKDEVKENTVQEVRKALQANIEAIQRATKLLEKQSDTLTSVMKQKIRELEESKNSFFRYEGLKLYLFWGGMVCNILVFLMLLYGMISK